MATDTPRKPLVVIAGNPNTGKTTVFNQLTGLRQRTGNYPGITVEKKAGTLTVNQRTLELLDLPGAYSLEATSPDEEVVAEVLEGIMPGQERPDLVVVVADASNVQRHLFLASQIAETGLPMLLVLNQWDVALRRNLAIDLKLLKQRLGIEVIAMDAKHGLGVDELKQAICQQLSKGPCMAPTPWPGSLIEARKKLQAAAEKATGRELSPFLGQRLMLDHGGRLRTAIGWTDDSARVGLEEARHAIRQAGFNPANVEPVIRYRHLKDVLEGAVKANADAPPRSSDSIDRLLCHRVWGLLLFIALMWFVFQSVYAWAGPLMDLVDGLFGSLAETVSPLLASTPTLQSLVVDGMIAGVGGVVIFLPQIFILFFFIGLLEDTGYMARAAFLMDKLFGWCGLNGKCFIPLLSSYACAVPGILSARTIEDPKARLATILAAPLMSCSARLPVYVLFIGAFIEPAYGPAIAGLVLLGMHFLGLVVAAPLVAILNRFVLKTPPQPFLLEMPDYHVPRLRDLLLRMWLKGREFLINAGTVIFAFSIIIWALLYFPHPQSLEDTVREEFVAAHSTETLQASDVEAALADPEHELAKTFELELAGRYVEQSFLARFGRSVQPIFGWAGFDWKLTVGVIASFPAREVIVSTLGIIYHLGADVDEESGNLRELLRQDTWEHGPRAGQPVVTIPVAVALMVFFALCLQCGATVAAIARESSWRWASFAFVGNTFVAWLAAVIAYQTGTWLMG